jgi:hypothetical protein
MRGEAFVLGAGKRVALQVIPEGTLKGAEAKLTFNLLISGSTDA